MSFKEYCNRHKGRCIAAGVIVLGLIVLLVVSLVRKKDGLQSATSSVDVVAKANTLALDTIKENTSPVMKPVHSMIEGSGIGILLDSDISREEYMDAAKGVAAFGYTNLGIAHVDNHLNVRETPEEGGKLVGKMSNNAACEILGYEGDWAHIKSGEVEGYCHTDYLLVGQMAYLKASQVITTEAESTSGGLRVRETSSTSAGILTTMAEGERLEVVEGEKDGWIKVLVDDQEGYISAEYAEIKEELATAMTMTELMYGEGVSDVRVDLCQYAKQFIGNPYVWGGTSLTNGADCSGFVMSVFKHYGISLPHSSRAQATMGSKVSLSEAKPGDLVFYSSGNRINHVAIYIGGGQVVHASNPKTGIRISAVGYRSISTIRRVIND